MRREVGCKIKMTKMLKYLPLERLSDKEHKTRWGDLREIMRKDA
jgi:hypothetical protein